MKNRGAFHFAGLGQAFQVEDRYYYLPSIWENANCVGDSVYLYGRRFGKPSGQNFVVQKRLLSDFTQEWSAHWKMPEEAFDRRRFSPIIHDISSNDDSVVIRLEEEFTGMIGVFEGAVERLSI